MLNKYGMWFFIALFLLPTVLPIEAIYSNSPLKEEYPLLILGCSRSGTTYITEVFKRCNYDIRHEEIGSDGVCSWLMTVDVDEVPYGEARSGRKFTHIFHQVANPLRVINSVHLTEPLPAIEFFRMHIPEIKPTDSSLVAAAKFWYYWNLKAEAQAEWTYRIEDLDIVWSEYGRRFRRILDRGAMISVDKNINTRGHLNSLKWNDLKLELEPDLYQKIQTLAKKYGYSITD